MVQPAQEQQDWFQEILKLVANNQFVAVGAGAVIGLWVIGKASDVLGLSDNDSDELNRKLVQHFMAANERKDTEIERLQKRIAELEQRISQRETDEHPKTEAAA